VLVIRYWELTKSTRTAENDEPPTKQIGKHPVQLNIDADITSLAELATDLLKRIERIENELDDNWNAPNENYGRHLRGLWAGYESVLSSIGYETPEN
jgi:hypothetical protein